MIKEILVMRGTAAVSPGDVVASGDVLVYGNDGKERVPAAAVVRASVWYTGGSVCPETEELRVDTGKEAWQISLQNRSGGKIILFGDKEPNFSHYADLEKKQSLVIWREKLLPVELMIRHFREQKYYLSGVGDTRSKTKGGRRRAAKSNGADPTTGKNRAGGSSFLRAGERPMAGGNNGGNA